MNLGKKKHIKSPTKKIMNTYHGDSLYKRGMDGRGETVGVISFGGISRKDIFHFWKHEQACTNPKRLSTKNVFNSRIDKDTSKNDGEADQDTEIPGSIAKNAKLKVFINPESTPTLTNFINAYLTAFDDSKLSSTTCSWGLGSTLPYLAKRHLISPHYRYLLNLVLAQGALEGISNFVASGDEGIHNNVKSIKNNQMIMKYQNDGIDPISTTPYITSVGATVRKFRIKGLGQTFNYNGPETSLGFVSNIWDKLPINLKRSKRIGRRMIVGSGGGFSPLYKTPNYQKGVPGVNTFYARQYFSKDLVPVHKTPKLIKGVHQGRNYPDISANMIGYQFYGNSAWGMSGGTSVTSPQFAGITALINSAPNHSKMGFWNPQIYQFAKYHKSLFTSFNSTKNNTNGYYTGQPGTQYNQATGLGIPNFTKLYLNYK